MWVAFISSHMAGLALDLDIQVHIMVSDVRTVADLRSGVHHHVCVLERYQR